MKKFKYIRVQLFIFLSGIILLELIFGDWIVERDKLNQLGILRNVYYEYNPYDLYQTTENAIYKRDQYGIRGESVAGQPSKINILTIGGSTTDQRYITEKKTWQAILESNFKESGQNLNVANAGLDGFSSHGHVQSFEHWFNKIPELKPKVILFYIGINDFFKILSEQREDNIFQGVGKRYRPQNKTIYREKSAFYHLYIKIKGIYFAEKMQLRNSKIETTNQFEKLEKTIDYDSLKWFQDGLLEFEYRLQQLMDYSKSMGSQVVLVTQPTNHYRVMSTGEILSLKDLLTAQNHRFNGIDIYNGLNLLNERMEQKAKQNNALFFNYFKDYRADDKDFYDYVHMTPQGTNKLGHYLFENLSKNLKY